MVLLSQELIGGLLACSFFCLFPFSDRGANHLRMINLDRLFASLSENYNEKQENKIKCIIHYFERICSSMPIGNVSFERKVLAVDQTSNYIPYPKAESWSKSVVPLCPFKVYSSGLIEDQLKEALEVDFANKYYGGGALNKGCVQEEIRFMINPELIAGIIFLPCMAENESIEVVGAERFSIYTGYASTVRFCGDFLDTKDSDIMGRRKTRIIAMDALSRVGKLIRHFVAFLTRASFIGMRYYSTVITFQKPSMIKSLKASKAIQIMFWYVIFVPSTVFNFLIIGVASDTINRHTRAFKSTIGYTNSDLGDCAHVNHMSMSNTKLLESHEAR